MAERFFCPKCGTLAGHEHGICPTCLSDYDTLPESAEVESTSDGLIIRCTAWDLLGSLYPLIDTTHKVYTDGMRVSYHSAEMTDNHGRGAEVFGVKLSRLRETDYGFQRVDRYLKPGAKVRLVPIKR